MAELDEIYDNLIIDVLDNGVDGGDRTGTGTRSVFGRQVRFDVDLERFPIVTEKKIVWNSLLTEIVWMLKGKTNIDFLHEHDVHIWDEWADEDGEVGPVYGKQWRDWENPNGENIDQLQRTIDNIRENPNSRRHLVSAWNPADLGQMALPPCHFAFQFRSAPLENGRKLDIMVEQRSCDLGLGVPFNWSAYAFVLAVVAALTGHETGEVVWNGGDVHIYQNHFDQMEKILELKHFEAPALYFPEPDSLEDVEVENVGLINYNHGPFVKMPVAV